MFCPPDAVLLPLGVGLCGGNGIQLGLMGFLFGYLTALVPEEPYHDKENQDKADD